MRPLCTAKRMMAVGCKTQMWRVICTISLRQGEVTEWFKERAWKVRIPQKGIEGSNPSLSAENEEVTKR